MCKEEKKKNSEFTASFTCKMKKFTFKGVLDGFRSSTVNQPSSLGPTRICTEQEIQETLRPEHFQLRKVNYQTFSKGCGLFFRQCNMLEYSNNV